MGNRLTVWGFASPVLGTRAAAGTGFVTGELSEWDFLEEMGCKLVFFLLFK